MVGRDSHQAEVSDAEMRPDVCDPARAKTRSTTSGLLNEVCGSMKRGGLQGCQKGAFL